ncbi:S10 family peptidase [Sphingobium lignivorans]|uniref:Carboxypeptidase C (Cathepsin A) n=1 Tax=Sphingobium lignivorans TaxID=2735886 RepID=A0ABR6NJA3_9SPHN|nr:peptidase S10 [Sphingobium lignivorans]MBB5987360.1 carboxypeptidase C (cathepsin A) [Sphingobium lignivorans]
MRFRFLLAAAALAVFQPAFAQSGDETNPAKLQAKEEAKQIAEHWASAPIEEVEKSYDSKVTVDGRVVSYKATAGTLTLRDAKGKPQHSIFYTAYTAPGANRPITFLFNGGPGSSSLWLRMGSFAPERVYTTDPVAVPPPPYQAGPNSDTLIGTTDLVFIDAPGAGYSRMLGDAKGSDFYGVDQDVAAFTKAIKRYITRNKRWASPRYVLGESYGTTRAGALAYSMEDEGMSLNGVMLLSTILNYGVRQSGFDNIHVGYLPSYAATAWYHNRIPNRPADLATFVQQARDFATGPYAAALAKGSDIAPQEFDSIAQQLAGFTGLSVDYIKSANLRVDLSRFRKELLRDRRETVGRFDSRYIGIDADAAGEGPEFDASSTGITGIYISSFMDQLTRKFGYETNLEYRRSAREGGDFNWDFSHREPEGRRQGLADTSVDLSAAMRINPHLRVLSLNGYYDMATPFHTTELAIKHLMLPPALMKNVTFTYYDGGHMMYLNPQALHQLRLDVQRFIEAGGKAG